MCSEVAAAVDWAGEGSQGQMDPQNQGWRGYCAHYHCFSSSDIAAVAVAVVVGAVAGAVAVDAGAAVVAACVVMAAAAGERSPELAGISVQICTCDKA